jgi:hypothetical protein
MLWSSGNMLSLEIIYTMTKFFDLIEDLIGPLKSLFHSQYYRNAAMSAITFKEEAVEM